MKSTFSVIYYLKRQVVKKDGTVPVMGRWKSHTNLTHPGKYFRPSKVKIM